MTVSFDRKIPDETPRVFVQSKSRVNWKRLRTRRAPK